MKTPSLCTFAVLLLFASVPLHSSSGIYQPSPHTLFYLPLDGPNAASPEPCTVVDPRGVLSYIPDRFQNPHAAIHVAGSGSASDSFQISCQNTKIAASASKSFTVGYWIRTTQALPGGGDCADFAGSCVYRGLTVLATGNNSGCAKYLTTALQFGQSVGAWPAACASNSTTITSSLSISDGGWHNLVWVFDYTSSQETFYLDGVVNTQAPLSVPPVTAASVQAVAGAENGTFALDGDMDDLWVEDTAWSASDIAQYFSAGAPSLWTMLSTTGGPPTTDASTVVYDHTSNRIILFGGTLGSPCCTSFNDVWVLTNANGLGGSPNWIKLNTATPNGAPTARAGQSAVYDSANNVMIIFGGGVPGPCGFYCTLFNDVWTLNNANGVGGTPTWIPLFPSGTAPIAREGHKAVYDSANNRMIVFGGGNNGIMNVPNDLWALTNANGLNGASHWIQLAESGQVPPRVEHFAVAYDSANNRMTIFGGCCYWNNNTWLLTNVNGLAGTPTWSQVSPAGIIPQIREVHAYGYDPALNELIIFGLGAAGVSYNDTWALSFANDIGGTPTWTNLIPNNTSGSPPFPFIAHDPGVYDAVSGRLMLSKLQDYEPGGLIVVPWVLAPASIAPVIPGNPPPTTPGGGSGIGSAQSPTSHQQPGAEPVSTGNGNYYYSHTDLSMPARGLPLVFQRSYNTLDNYSGPLGANWTHSFNIVLTQTSGGVATVRWGDSHGETFTLTGTNYVPQAGIFSTFAANSDRTYTLTEKNLTKYNFSAGGKLTSVQDKNGNTVLLTYNGGGNLTQITDAVGRSLNLSYDSGNRITQVTDPIGRSMSYAYDRSNNLDSVTDTAGGVTQYAYDSSHHVMSITRPDATTLLQNSYDTSGRVISQTNGRGLTWQFAYDVPRQELHHYRRTRQPTIHTYDLSLRILKITDQLAARSIML